MMHARILKADAAKEYDFSEGCHILELLNTTDDPAVSIARARVPSGRTTHWHALRGTSERYLIRDGQGRVEVAGLPPTPVGPGDVVLIPPDTPQRITASGADDLVFYAICTPRFTPACYCTVPDPGTLTTDAD